MRKSLILLIAGVLCSWIYSCKKESKTSNVNNTLAAYPNEIVGTWLAVKSHAKVYSEDGTHLYLDTTALITDAWNNAAWNEVYNKNGNAYKIYYYAGSSQLLPDTNLIYKYAISGSNLMIYEQGGVSYPEPILKLDSASMELENTFDTSFTNAGWNLPRGLTYKVITDVTYRKL